MGVIGVARAVGRSVIPRLFREGYSANAALRQLRSMGMGYRRITYLADWRELTGVTKLENVVKYVRKGYRPSPSLFVEKAMAVGRERTYTAEMELYKRSTGESTKENYSITTDEDLTVEQAEREIEKHGEEGMSWPGWEVTKTTLISCKRRPG